MSKPSIYFGAGSILELGDLYPDREFHILRIPEISNVDMKKIRSSLKGRIVSEIIYQKGTMRLDLSPAFLRNQPSKISVYEDRGRSTGLLYQPTFDWDWAFKNQAKSFIENLVNKTQPIANGIDSFEDFNFIDQIWKGILNE